MKRQPNAVLAWVSNLKLVATTLRVTSAAVPVPGLQAVFEGAVMILDLVERVGKNDTDLKYLAESVINITSLLNDELRSRPNGADNRLEKLCKDYIRYLDNVAEELHKVLAPKPKFWFKKYLKERSIRNNLDEFTRKLTDLRADLTLAAAIGSNFQITDTHQRVRELHSAFSRVSSEEDIRVFKPSELWLDFETVNVGVVSLREDPPGSAKADQVLVRSYLAKVGEAKATTVRIYEGARASQMWKWDLDMFSANLRVPGVAQIYGMCTSPRFKALIFHDELVPIDVYATSIISPMISVDFELKIIQNFMSAFSHISTLVGVVDVDYREVVADLALIRRSTGTLLISHLPYNTDDTDVIVTQEKHDGGPVHAWFSSCGCLARLPHERLDLCTSGHLRMRVNGAANVLAACSKMGNLSRYRGLSASSDDQPLKVGSIYLQRPGDLEIVHTIADVSTAEREIYIEDWTARGGVFEEFPGWTSFEVELRMGDRPGYFLSTFGSVYMPVAEIENQRTSWLLHAESVIRQSNLLELGWDFHDMLIAELFFVNLDWALILEEGTYDVKKLPLAIYVSVENIPVDADGVISSPTAFWSVEPHRKAPYMASDFRIEQNFSARGSGRAWERHHYDAARSVLQQNDIDPTTRVAADSLGLPKYAVSTVPTPHK